MNIKEIINNGIQKLKIDKKTAFLVVTGFIAILLLFFSELDFSDGEKVENDNQSQELSSVTYCEYLEDKVKEIVESIDGAGEAKVMITLSETTEYVYATNDKDTAKNSNNDSNTTYENDYVIIDSNNNDTGLLIKTIEPKVRGVAVVCEGGNNSSVQQQIYSAVGAVLNISTSRISISKLTITEEKK